MIFKLLVVLQLMQSLLAIEHAFMIRVKPDGSITKKIDGVNIKQTVKKVFVDLIIEGQYIFRRKRFVGNKRVCFLCKSCEDMNKFVTCCSEIVIHNADNPEEDEYILDESTVPLPSEHHCTPSGIFNMHS